LPASRVDATSQLEKGTVVLTGDFDADKIRKVVKEREGELDKRQQNGLDVYATDDGEFALPTSDRLIVTMGSKGYRNGVWKLAAEGGTSFEQTAEKHGLFDGLDTSRPIWMVNRLKGAKDRTSSKVDSAGISLGLDSGAQFQVVTRVGNEADAKAVAQQVEAIKKKGSESTMLTMFGAGPLVSNLGVERDGTTVIATTSMTEAELDVLVEKVRQLAASQSSMSIPSSGASGGSKSQSDSSDSSKSKDDSTKN
ncbi:MAG: hypothetical protein ABEN55_20510, partial [Bradymonadaceae bacterium]